MRIKKVLHDNVLVKVEKAKEVEEKTSSGIYLAGIEQDFVYAEVVMVGPGTYDEDGVLVPTQIEPGMKVIFEKNFHHLYGVDNQRNPKLRLRIDHTIKVDEDAKYNYYLTLAKDIYLVAKEDEEAENIDIFGELYSIMPAKPVSRGF